MSMFVEGYLQEKQRQAEASMVHLPGKSSNGATGKVINEFQYNAELFGKNVAKAVGAAKNSMKDLVAGAQDTWKQGAQGARDGFKSGKNAISSHVEVAKDVFMGAAAGMEPDQINQFAGTRAHARHRDFYGSAAGSFDPMSNPFKGARVASSQNNTYRNVGQVTHEVTAHAPAIAVGALGIAAGVGLTLATRSANAKKALRDKAKEALFKAGNYNPSDAEIEAYIKKNSGKRESTGNPLFDTYNEVYEAPLRENIDDHVKKMVGETRGHLFGGSSNQSFSANKAGVLGHKVASGTANMGEKINHGVSQAASRMSGPAKSAAYAAGNVVGKAQIGLGQVGKGVEVAGRAASGIGQGIASAAARHPVAAGAAAAGLGLVGAAALARKAMSSMRDKGIQDPSDDDFHKEMSDHQNGISNGADLNKNAQGMNGKPKLPPGKKMVFGRVVDVSGA